MLREIDHGRDAQDAVRGCDAQTSVLLRDEDPPVRSPGDRSRLPQPGDEREVLEVVRAGRAGARGPACDEQDRCRGRSHGNRGNAAKTWSTHERAILAALAANVTAIVAARHGTLDPHGGRVAGPFRASPRLHRGDAVGARIDPGLRRPSPPARRRRAPACSTSARATRPTGSSSTHTEYRDGGLGAVAARRSGRRSTSSARRTRCRSRTRAFDAVLCTQVLEHVPEPRRVLAELRTRAAAGRPAVPDGAARLGAARAAARLLPLHVPRRRAPARRRPASGSDRACCRATTASPRSRS